MKALAVGICTVLASFVLLACGGKKPVVADVPKTDVSDGGADADGATTSDTTNTADAGGASATPEAASAPAPVSCLALGSCTELTASGKEAADAKDRCKAASGEAKDAPCSKDDVVATCALPKGATLYHYKGQSPEQTKGRLKGGESGCKAAGGTWALVGKPAGKTKPKPKKP
jgi:hypothetical protein